MTLQPTTFENIVTKRELAHYEKFLLLLNVFNSFQLLHLHLKKFPYLCLIYDFKVVCSRLFVCVKGVYFKQTDLLSGGKGLT